MLHTNFLLKKLAVYHAISMGCIKRMEIPLGEETLTFGDDTKELFNEVRRLYMSGAKNGNEEDYTRFLVVSAIMINVLGKDRILKAKDKLHNISPKLLQRT